MDGLDLIIYLCGFFSIIILSGTLFILFYEAFRDLKLRLDKKRFNDLINIQVKINEVLNEYYKIKKGN